MKKIATIIMVMFAVISLSSCGVNLNLTKKNMMRIEEGMNKQEVKGILGSPENRSFDQGRESWEYISVDGKVFIVFFYDDRVVGMDTFNKEPRPSHDAHEKH